MTPNDYQILASMTEPSTKEPIREKFSNEPIIRAQHHLMGISTETGELIDNFKRHCFYNTPLDITNIEEELGDILWYIAGLCNTYNLSLEKIMEKNIEKLKVRFPENFHTNDNAINRDLDAERKILEG